jgi:hypothetical protein
MRRSVHEGISRCVWSRCKLVAFGFTNVLVIRACFVFRASDVERETRWLPVVSVKDGEV